MSNIRISWPASSPFTSAACIDERSRRRHIADRRHLGNPHLGLLISTAAQNQGQARQFTLLTMLPSILLSGFVFPRDTMPGPLYLLSFAIPVTHFLDVLRGIVVRGAGLLDVLPSLLILCVITVILLSAATLRFRKSMA